MLFLHLMSIKIGCLRNEVGVGLGGITQRNHCFVRFCSFQVANHGFALKFLSLPPEVSLPFPWEGPEVLVAPRKVQTQV